MILDHLGVPINQPRQDLPDLPLGTYFSNAGLSDAEAIDASRECLRRAKAILVKHLRDLEIENPGSARRYAVSHNERIKLNKECISSALVSMGFDSRELREIERGTRLNLQAPENFVPIARVTGPSGVNEFEVKDLDPQRENGKTVLLTDRNTGKREAF